MSKRSMNLKVISSVPHVRRYKLDFKWEFVVLGSNSIWKRISNEAMVHNEY